MGVYLRPSSLAEALDALARQALTPLAGGTDIFPTLANLAAWNQAPALDLLDLSALPELTGIEERETAFHLGALTTWTEIVESGLPDWFEGLRQAAREVGGLQIQNRGTLAGNLCNASPAADGLPALLALEAEVELASRGGTRRLPLGEFVLGNRKTARRPDELVVALRVPKPRAPARSTFLKLGARRYLVISIAMVAATLEVEDGRVAAARVAVGSCSAVAQRLPALESALLGRPCDATLAEAVEPRQFGALSPIDDPRASAGYREEAVVTLARRALAALAGEPLERAA